VNDNRFLQPILELHCDTQGRLITAFGPIAAKIPIDYFGEKLIGNLVFIDGAYDVETFIEGQNQTARLAVVSGVYRIRRENLSNAEGTIIGFVLRLFTIEISQENSSSMHIGNSNATRQGSVGILVDELGQSFRLPLGRIIANADSIGQKLEGPLREHYTAYAKDISTAARHLLALLEDMNDLSAIERADFSPADDKIELGDIARRAAGLLSLKAADQQMKIVLPSEGQAVQAIAEFRRVLQIAINLISNAINYSPAGTSIVIEIGNIAGKAIFSVTDAGMGVAEEDRMRIFEKFERLGRSGDGGSGLGLYISRRLARAMGGDLYVESATHAGARFVLKLPLQ
jgi:signal transduction histidine kinase